MCVDVGGRKEEREKRGFAEPCLATEVWGRSDDRRSGRRESERAAQRKENEWRANSHMRMKRRCATVGECWTEERTKGVDCLTERWWEKMDWENRV